MAGAEMLLQYLWEHRLWDYGSLKTIDGRRVNIIDQGRRNQDSGPDFFNAKIEIDGHVWAGNVEIHVRASDWHRHGHHADRAYDSVILHVVGHSDAFERVAYATPLRCLLKHRSDRRLLEATLFGQAGFLATAGNDPEHPGYVDDLRADYGFMKAKYGLSAPESPGWKMARMRPPNLPHRRIAALAAIIADGFRFGSAFSHVTNQADARNLFTTEITGYWATHYTFGPSSAYVPRAFSPDSVTSLIINAVVPLLYAYGVYFGDDSKTAAAVELLQSLPPENNSVTRIFTDQGIPCDDAFSSQALIQLRRAYCEPRKCLYCRIGHRILASKAKP